MPNANEWLFDALWELSDKAHEADLPVLAEKLEEAMDTYLLESQPGGAVPAAFQSQRYSEADQRIMKMAKTKARTVQALNALVAQTRAQTLARAPKQIAASDQQVVRSFAWPY